MEKISVLYVDDEPTLLDLAKIYLEKTGWLTISILPSAIQAIEHLKSHTYDAIVSDYQMPDMDGIEFLKIVRKQYDGIPFILFTGRGREEVVVEALNSGADSYIQKGGNVKAQFVELQQKIKINVERRQAQSALRESEKKYRQLVENAQESVYIIQDEKFCFFNPKFNEVIERSGFSREEFLSKPFFTFIHPDEQQMMRERYHKRIDHDEKFSMYSFRFVNPAGDIIWWEVDAIKIEWNDRPATLNFSRDVTEQYRLKQRVTESECRYKELVESLPKTVIELNDQFNLTFINKAGQKKFGYSSKDLAKNLSAMALVCPNERERIRNIYLRAKNGENVPEHEAVAMRKDGTTFPMIVYLSSIRRKKKIIGFRLVCMDISESQKLKEKLVQSNTKLFLMSQITRHDFQNKLMGFRGYLALAQEQSTEQTVKNYLQKMEYIADILQEQLEFTKMYQEIGMSKPEWHTVEKNVLSALQTFPMEKIKVNVNLEGFEIYTDCLLGKVIYNLFDNSLRHGEHVTEIKIYAVRKDPELVLVYEDNGIGISNPDKKHLFTYGFGKNTGLGLFLIREILNITGISITETGEYQKGVRFEIHIPPDGYRFARDVPFLNKEPCKGDRIRCDNG